MLWKPLEAGELDKRVRIVLPKKAATKTSYGSTKVTPLVIAEVWASIEDLSGVEPFFAEQASPDTTHLVKIRYLNPKGGPITSRNQLLYGPGWTRVFEITSINDPMQRHEQLLIMVKEKTFTQA